ncbi:MAG: PaaI family thioesterase [Desulfuromonadales bacterium]|nr:PaaI family thioesterase [Desulfuromonadales bacterium]
MLVKGVPFSAENHSHCVMCGELNPLSLRLNFVPDGSGAVSAFFQGNVLLQGYDGILHGGVISALLDSAMTHCLFHRKIEAVTGELLVKFAAPVPYNVWLTVRGWLVSATPPLHVLKAELLQAGAVMASADAKFMQRYQYNGQY